MVSSPGANPDAAATTRAVWTLSFSPSSTTDTANCTDVVPAAIVTREVTINSVVSMDDSRTIRSLVNVPDMPTVPALGSSPSPSMADGDSVTTRFVCSLSRISIVRCASPQFSTWAVMVAVCVLSMSISS